MHLESVDLAIKVMQINVKIAVYYVWLMNILINLDQLMSVKNVLNILIQHLDQLVLNIVCHNTLVKKVIILFRLQIVIHQL